MEGGDQAAGRRFLLRSDWSLQTTGDSRDILSAASAYSWRTKEAEVGVLSETDVHHQNPDGWTVVYRVVLASAAIRDYLSKVNSS